MTATILCIEDEGLLLADISEEVQDAGYRVLTATNGKEAIEILKYETIDLILCDIMMPLIDGPTTLKLVRERLPQHDEVPFIFLTAKSTREDILAGKKLGADDYLTKPIDYDLLLATIEARLSQITRIKETNESRLKRIYYSLKEEHHDKDPLSISLVSKSHTYILPIERALRDLGCMVEFIPEDDLVARKDAVEKNDLCFLLYSKIVHFYINGLIKAKTSHGRGKTILLCKDDVDKNLKNAMVELGIGRTISHPFPPVEIFKVILEATQNR